MTEPVKNSEKCRIKFKKSTDVEIALSKKKRRPLYVHNKIKTEDLIFCDHVINEKKLKDVVKRNVSVGHHQKDDDGREQSQLVALISDEQCSPNNVFQQEIEVKESSKGLKNIAAPVDTNANCSQVLGANNEVDEMCVTAEKKSKSTKHKKKLKQKMCLKQLKRNTHSHIKFPKKFRKHCGNNESLRVTTTIDENLPCGWKKCAVQRKGGSSIGKWDVFYISPQGRKFRSRNELVSHLKEVDQMVQRSKFDFSFHQCKRACKSVENDHKAEEATSRGHVSSVSTDTQNTNFASEPPKRIKTLLPKIRAQEEENETSHICMCESSIGNEDCLSSTLKLQPLLECHKSLSSSSVFQPGPENFHPAASFMPLSKTDSESGENWVTFGVTAEEPCQYTDEPKPTRCIKNNVSKEADISSLSSGCNMPRNRLNFHISYSISHLPLKSLITF